MIALIVLAIEKLSEFLTALFSGQASGNTVKIDQKVGQKLWWINGISDFRNKVNVFATYRDRGKSNQINQKISKLNLSYPLRQKWAFVGIFPWDRLIITVLTVWKLITKKTLNIQKTNLNVCSVLLFVTQGWNGNACTCSFSWNTNCIHKIFVKMSFWCKNKAILIRIIIVLLMFSIDKGMIC